MTVKHHVHCAICSKQARLERSDWLTVGNTLNTLNFHGGGEKEKQENACLENASIEAKRVDKGRKQPSPMEL